MLTLFKPFSEISATLSQKKDGSMRLATKQEDWLPLNVENRKRYFEKLGLSEKKIIAAQLVHGKRAALVDHNSPDYILETDGLVTSDPTVVLTVTVADCYPVYFYDGKKRIIGLAHVGWLGAVKNIITEMVRLMKGEGSDPQDIVVAIGPGICQKHYAIPRERMPILENYQEAILKEGGQAYLDIKKIICRQLKENGIVTLIDTDECTYNLSEKYFSYRRDKPEIIEAQVACITLEKKPL